MTRQPVIAGTNPKRKLGKGTNPTRKRGGIVLLAYASG